MWDYICNTIMCNGHHNFTLYVTVVKWEHPLQKDKEFSDEGQNTTGLHMLSICSVVPKL